MKKLFLLLTAVAVLAMSFSVAVPTATATKKVDVQPSPNGVYIVQMVDEPVVAYEGGIQGLDATAPAKGRKIDPNSPAVANYVKHLNGKQDAALGQVGGGRKLYSYTYSFNGFAAELSLDQAKKMATVDGVKAVTADELHQMDTASTPDFLGLTADGGLWDQLGSEKNAGEGIIIGVVDSGIWPESLSFTDRIDKTTGDPAANGKLVYQQIPGWHGKCTPGEDFNASMCNQKLIGAQYFNAAWGGDAGIDAQRPWEFNSPRDYNGHGSHTSSTAGGNYGVPVTGPAAVFGTISGMAPRARIAMYKALWSTQDASTANGYTSDLVAAIDQAVADGVDVINYSISGSKTEFLCPAMLAYLYAARAGIFASLSAGNSGPAESTVAHCSPWVTTVAAGTHNRSVNGSVTLGDATYYGPSLATTAVTAPLIDSTAAGLPGADPNMVALCYAAVDNFGIPVLDPALVAGKIVVCDRGVTARVNKSLAVMEAGGVGMILVNTSATQSLNADLHYVPTVHLASADRAAVKAYAATPGATATINPAVISYTTPAPYTAAFSSRGPMLAGGGDVLKPDVMAPGVDVLAAVSPASGPGLSFNLYSGTSMSAPHVAGAAALLKQRHPDWSPMMIKSALMTSAYDVLDGPGTNPLVIFRQGAGHIAPNGAADPGLVYDAGWNHWLAFLCGTTPGAVAPSTCDALAGMGYSLDPSDMNVASIAIGDLAGAQTIKRTVTSVGAKPEKYTFGYSGLSGITVVPSVESFNIQPGASQSFDVTFTAAGAALNAYVGGYITWTGNKGHVVRVPVVIKPVALAAPASLFGTGDPISYDVVFGYDGPFTASARGLIPATTFDGAVNTGDYALYEVSIPDGTTYARFSLFDANVSPASDLDLYIYNSAFALVGSSGGATSAEEVNLANPAAGTYYALVDGYATGNPSTFTLFTWAIGNTDAGNMTVAAPATAVLGATGTINLTFTGLAPATKYLGSVAYSGADGMPNPTIVRVDTP